MLRGHFITFEGGEGSGKSTQVRLLAGRLEKAGKQVVATREPGGSPLAERIRAILLDGDRPPMAALTEALLFSAARSDHLDQTIRPALARGQWVICDRFADSTRMYQGVAGGIAAAVVETLEGIVVGQSKPDLTIILDVPADVGLSRVAGRRLAGGAPSASDSFEARDLTFHERLREGYVRLAETESQRCVLVDAMQPPDAIVDVVWAHLVARGLVESP
jgi:dTMP kinase